MANEVKIILTAVDHASAKLKGIDGGFKTMLSGIGAVAGVAAAAGAAINKVINDTVNYAKTVDDLSRSLGTSTEEASKLIQIADDLRIEQGQLEMAFRFALNKGVDPSIKGLKALQAEYQKIENPIERAQFAMEKFGTRGGLQMQKVLELTSEELEKMAKSAEEAGLVLSKDGVEATKKYYAEIDTLKDKWAGFTTQIGMEIIPMLNDLFDTMNGEGVANSQLPEMVERLNEAYKLGGITIEQYNDAQGALRHGYALSEDAVRSLTNAEIILRDDRRESIEALEATKVVLDDFSGVANKSWAQMYALSDAIRAGADAAEEAQKPIKNLLDGLDRDPSNPIAGFIKDLEWLQAGGLNINKKVDEVMAAVASGGLTPQEGKQMLEGAFTATQDLQAELGNITADEAAANVSNTLGISLEDAKARINGTDGIIAAMAAFTSTPWYVDIYYREHNKPSGGGGGGGGGGGSGGGGSGGGGGGSGGSGGGVIPQGVTFSGDIIVVGTNGMDAQMLAGQTAYQIEKRTSLALKAGAGYAGY